MINIPQLLLDATKLISSGDAPIAYSRLEAVPSVQHTALIEAAKSNANRAIVSSVPKLLQSVEAMERTSRELAGRSLISPGSTLMWETAIRAAAGDSNAGAFVNPAMLALYLCGIPVAVEYWM